MERQKQRHPMHPRLLVIGVGLSLLASHAAAAPQVAPTLDTPLDGKNSVVHCPTLLAMWANVITLVGGPVLMADQDPVLDALNAERCPPDTLPEGAYVAMAGFADRGIADKIEAELRAKFGGAAPPLPTGFRENPPLLFVSYCHLQRRLFFPQKFTRSQNPLEFIDRTGITEVKNFRASGSMSATYSADVRILRHTEQRGFAVRLNSKVKDEFIVLATMARPPTLRQGVLAVRNLLQRKPDQGGIESGDLLIVPIIKIKVADNFPNLCDRLLLNPGFEKTYFYRVHQDIRFHMDESGAKVKSTAFGEEGYFGDIPKPKPPRPRQWRFVFDRPFLLTVWRKDAEQPYLAIWVTEDILVPW
jgi:hypothetical protein